MLRWFKNIFRKRKPKPVSKKPVFDDEGRLTKINIEGNVNFSEDELDFLRRTLFYLEKVISSDIFYHKFIRLRVRETNGKSLQTIYREIREGKEQHDRMVDYSIDLFLSLYGNKDQHSKTIGYSNTVKIWTNKYWVNKWMNMGAEGLARYGGHLFHEYLHEMGYKHRYIKSRSLVYKAGYLARDLIRLEIENE